MSLGHDASVSSGVVDALRSSGISGESLITTARSLAGRPEVGEDAGLTNLLRLSKQSLHE